MLMSGTVCAIIPTYNRSGMLRECIDSILMQSYPPQQIIVVNDGSTDDTETVVQRFGDRVQLITKPNGGKAAALNFALVQCKTDYVWICDDDDVAAPDGLEHLVKALDADASLGFVFGTFNIFKDTDHARAFTPPTYWRRYKEPNPRINFLEEMFTFQYAMLVRRSLYQQVDRFREDMIRSQDYEMTLRLLQNTTCDYVPHVIFHQRQHEGTRGASQDSFAIGQAMQKWLSYDQKIFMEVRRSWTLDEFTPTFATNWPQPEAHRAALVERGCVFAKRALWGEAIADLRQAATSASTPPTADEIDIAESIIRTSLPWAILVGDRHWIHALHELYKLNAFGQGIVLAACRPLIWQSRTYIRNGDIGSAFILLRLLSRITGFGGMMRRILKSLIKR